MSGIPLAGYTALGASFLNAGAATYCLLYTHQEAFMLHMQTRHHTGLQNGVLRRVSSNLVSAPAFRLGRQVRAPTKSTQCCVITESRQMQYYSNQTTKLCTRTQISIYTKDLINQISLPDPRVALGPLATQRLPTSTSTGNSNH